MAGTVRARMRGGMLELLEKVDLPEGKEVSVTILEMPASRDTATKGMLEALRATAGGWKGLVDGKTLSGTSMLTALSRLALPLNYEISH